MRRFVIALIWILAALPLAGQEADPFIESVDVQLVVVDVHVTDGQGRPVLDLGRDDFRVYEDGQPVAIEQLSVFTDGSVRPAAAAGDEPAASRSSTRVESRPPAAGQLIIFLDNLHVGPAGRDRVFDQLLDTLKRELRPGDEVMVAAYNGSVDVLLPLTDDRRALRQVLDNERRYGARALTASLGQERVLQLIEERHRQTLEGNWPDPCTDIGFIARTYAEQTFAQVGQTVDELERFVDSLAGLPGRKTLLHVSDGIPMVSGQAAYRYAIELCDGSGAVKGVPNAIDTVSSGARYNRWDSTQAWAELTQFDASKRLRELAAHANTYQVSFYTLQSKPLRSHGSSQVDSARTSIETDRDAARNVQDSLFFLANETGGRAIFDTNSFEAPLAEMMVDARTGYQLAYAPPTPGDGRHHNLRVEVDRPGVRVRHRQSYRSKSVHERVADEVRTALVHGRSQNPLAAHLEVVGQAEVSKTTSQVTIRMRLPLNRLVLLPQSDGGRGLFTVFVAARDALGGLTPVGQRTIPVTVNAGDDAAAEYVYEVAIPLRKADHLVAVAVRDEIGGESSYLTEAVAVGGS